MIQLFIAASEATANPPGDDLAGVAYVLLGIAMIVAAVASVIVTPGAEDHH